MNSVERRLSSSGFHADDVRVTLSIRKRSPSLGWISAGASCRWEISAMYRPLSTPKTNGGDGEQFLALPPAVRQPRVHTHDAVLALSEQQHNRSTTHWLRQLAKLITGDLVVLESPSTASPTCPATNGLDSSRPCPHHGRATAAQVTDGLSRCTWPSS